MEKEHVCQYMMQKALFRATHRIIQTVSSRNKLDKRLQHKHINLLLKIGILYYILKLEYVLYFIIVLDVCKGFTLYTHKC